MDCMTVAVAAMLVAVASSVHTLSTASPSASAVSLCQNPPPLQQPSYLAPAMHTLLVQPAGVNLHAAPASMVGAFFKHLAVSYSHPLAGGAAGTTFSRVWWGISRRRRGGSPSCRKRKCHQLQSFMGFATRTAADRPGNCC